MFYLMAPKQGKERPAGLQKHGRVHNTNSPHLRRSS